MSLHCPPIPSLLEVAADTDGHGRRERRSTASEMAGPSEATGSVEQVWGDLQALLHRAALLDPVARVDAPEWEVVAEGAARATRRLASFGLLRGNLVVSVEDPPVVVGRLLAAASRRATCLYAATSTGRSAWESNTTADA